MGDDPAFQDVGGELQVVAGSARGSILRAPRSRGVRPTSSRVRGAIFNILPPQVVSGARVLELYAGTGALGIEALSRGARWVDFVEQDPEMCRLIRGNLESAGMGDRAHVYRSTAKKALSFLQEPYDLALMDPPYGSGGVEGTLARLEGSGLLKDEAVVVVEHAARTPMEARSGRLALSATRRYGDTAVSFYGRETGP